MTVTTRRSPGSTGSTGSAGSAGSTGSPLGAAEDRLDGQAKTTGAATFSAEYPLDDIAYAAVVHAPIASGTIATIDVSAAERCPGVITVITHLNAPKLKPTPRRRMINVASLTPGTTVNLLNTDTIHFDGQPVAVVVAHTLDAAHEGASLVDIRYTPGRVRSDLLEALPDARPLKNAPMQEKVTGRTGRAEQALASADVRVDMEFTTPEQNHNTLELHSTTAAWRGDQLTVYDGCQAMSFTVMHLAQKFGIPAQNVHVVSRFVGGAFGSKSFVWPHTVLAAMAARVVDRPVKLVLTRAGVYRTVGGRTASRQRVALGADSSGTLTALIHTAVTRRGSTGGLDEPVTNGSAETYAADHLEHRQTAVELDLVPNTYMRAPGEAIGTFALESAVDQLAHDLDQDPVDWRLANLATTTPIGQRDYSHRRIAECLRRGADLFGWSSRTPTPGSMVDANHTVGWGTAVAFHPAMLMNANVAVSLSADGTLQVRSAFHEMGMGSATAVRQIAAHLAGLPTDLVIVDYGDTSLPTGPIAGGSAQTAALAKGLEKAIAKLTGELHSLARSQSDSPLHRSRRDDVVLRDGGLYLGDRGESIATILERAGTPSIDTRVGRDSGIGALAGQVGMVVRSIRDERRWSRAATGAHFCEVRIDRDTGEMRVSRWVGVFDIGRVVNHKTASSQIRGGVVMGLGLAMFEATHIDPVRGRIMNPSLTEYHIPVHADVPPIDVQFIDDADPTMPLGIVGAGEVGITGVAGAIANAVFHATGRRICDLPITLDKLVG